ncbi:DUF4097 domain-containing protein [Microbacterium sp. KUDC0406]|uniref:DUF4097 family beta strand repeat-containing protein n=1 Tax=Microbacterium sp. KUDC0406 TaxID=2909588 RepID=UPI001F359190|nr:DUF4097 family beta strand repeat-containing protein [Microbacterium sp. KUDC0406]UJP10708.1 DUF4097 domain-containing protein [Microbacterium sp. KUDC0406]
MSTRLFAFALVSLLTAVTLTACSSATDVDPERASFAIDGEEVTISMESSGDISLRPGDVDEIEVTRWFTGGGDEASWDFTGDELTLAVECGFLSSCEVRYEVVVPRTVAVFLRGSNADVLATGFEAPLDIRTENGAIIVEDIEGDLSLRSTSGDQQAKGLTAQRVEAQASSGAVDLFVTEAPSRLAVATENGAVSVQLPDAAYALSVQTDSGSIENSFTDDSRSPHTIAVTTANGDIALTRTGP